MLCNHGVIPSEVLKIPLKEKLLCGSCFKKRCGRLGKSKWEKSMRYPTGMRATQALTWMRAWKIVVPAAGLGIPAACKAVPMTKATTDSWFQLMKMDSNYL